MNSSGKIEKNWFFIDAETDGLYGPLLTVAIAVTDSRLQLLEEHYFGIADPAAIVKEEWVREHVLPILGEYEILPSEDAVLDRVWELWMKYRDSALAVADVIYPVETGIFRRCVLKDEENRRFLAPYPLLDLSSLLYAKGIDPLAERSGLIDRKETAVLTQHNALDDVRMTIEIFKKLDLAKNRADASAKEES